MADDTNDVNAVELATELTIAWLSNANTRASADEVPAFLARMHDAVSGLAGGAAPEQPDAGPAYEGKVTARKSLASRDHIISMIDGKPYKTLRRHLSGHGLSPDQYRERYNLKADYPMVAETYSQHRRDMAKKIGLGRKPRGQAAGDAAPTDDAPAATPRPRGRPKKAAVEA